MTSVILHLPLTQVKYIQYSIDDMHSLRHLTVNTYL